MHYFINERPEDIVYNETPARFTWMPVDGVKTYTIKVFADASESNLKYAFDGVDRNYFTPDVVMDSGVYYWCLYSGDKKLIGPKRFEIAPNAVKTPLIKRELRYKNISGHPRVWINKDEIASLKHRLATDLKPDFDELLDKSVNVWMSTEPHGEPERYPNDKRDMTIWRGNYIKCQECLNAIRNSALAYVATDDKKYFDNAKKWLMTIAGWDLNGATARAYNDEAGFRVLSGLAWGYDWLYNELTEEERAHIRNILTIRGRELYDYVTKDITIQEKLLDSHGIRSVSMALVPAALALYGDEPEAETWLNFALEYYMNIYTPWGGSDGGWAEGPAYWQMGVAFVIDACNFLRRTTGINVLERPFFQNTADFPLFVYCQDMKRIAFCDMSDLGDYPQLKAGFNARLLSAFSKSPNMPYYLWYYNEAAKRNSGKDKLFFNYGWWNFQFDNIVYNFDFAERVLDAKTPPAGLMVKWFRDVDWAVIHKDIANEDDHVGFMFKSSPYGSVSHSHGDQNAFVLHAYGEPLAIHSGYYIGFFSDMHMKWRRQTKSKNAILIDGVGQLADAKIVSKSEEFNGSLKSKFETLIAANGKIEDVKHDAQNVYIRGNATNAYKPLVEYLEKYLRHVVYVDAEFFVIIDEVKLSQEGCVNWLMHSLDQFNINGQSFTVDRPKAGLETTFVNVSSGAVSIEQTDVFDGISEKEIEGLPNQWHLSATTKPAKEHTIVSLLNVYKSGQRRPIEYSYDTASGAHVFTLAGKKYSVVKNGAEYIVKS